jgi:hypothetical protein
MRCTDAGSIAKSVARPMEFGVLSDYTGAI